MATTNPTGSAPVAVLTREQRDSLWEQVATANDFGTPNLRDSPREFEAVMGLLGEIGWTRRGDRDVYRITVTPTLAAVVLEYRTVVVNVRDEEPMTRETWATLNDEARAMVLDTARALEAIDLILDHADLEALADPVSA